MEKLPDKILIEYTRRFFGFGRWGAPIWFIGMEEAGGWDQIDIKRRLAAWQKTGEKELEDAPTFYPMSGNSRWHGPDARLQQTWKQLIRMSLIARGQPNSDLEILDYQRKWFGGTTGNECALELLPLPSPTSTVWNYRDWSDLPWLQSRASYQNFMTLERARILQQRIEQQPPKVLIFYASTWHRLWALIARGPWGQAIPGKLMVQYRADITYYVTRHPRAETDDYFTKIGLYLQRKHANIFK